MKRLIFLLPLLIALLPAVGNGSAANRAGVVIRYADGTVRSSCVSFDEASISGLELLQRAQAEVIAQPAPGNAAVCKIGADGCDYPAEPCFCKFGAGNSGEYWAYWQLDGAAWRYGQQGAGARRVGNGDVDGWAYGSGSGRSGSVEDASVQTGVQPPVVTFAEVCPLASQALDEPSGASEPLASQPLATQPLASLSATAEAPASALPEAPSEAPLPVAGAASAGEPDGAQPGSGWASYAVFGIMLAAILGAVALAVRRRGAM